MVTKWSRSWTWITYCHPWPLFNVKRPSHCEIQLRFDHENCSRTCVWSKIKVTFDLENTKVKVMAKVKSTGHVWGLQYNRHVCFSFLGNRLRFNKFHIWPWKFKVKVMTKIKPGGHIWGLEFNQYGCFSFRENRTILGWDIANSIFNLENSRPRSNPMSHLRPMVQSICLLFVLWQSDHFWLRFIKFHIWPWKFKGKVKTKINQNLIR